MSIVPNTVKTADLPSSESDQAKIDAWRKQGEQMLQSRQIAKLPAKFNDDKMAAIQVSLDAISDFAGTDIAVLNSGLFFDAISSGNFNRS